MTNLPLPPNFFPSFRTSPFFSFFSLRSLQPTFFWTFPTHSNLTISTFRPYGLLWSRPTAENPLESPSPKYLVYLTPAYPLNDYR